VCSSIRRTRSTHRSTSVGPFGDREAPLASTWCRSSGASRHLGVTDDVVWATRSVLLGERTAAARSRPAALLVEKEYRQSFCKASGPRERLLLAERVSAPDWQAAGASSHRLDTFLARTDPPHGAQRREPFDFAEIMNGQKISSPNSLRAIARRTLIFWATLLVSKFHQLALAGKTCGQRPSAVLLYIDEFHNFVTPSWMFHSVRARKYRWG